jgi:hypothetical protein
LWGGGINRFILAFLIDVSEDVIENKISGGLLGKDEGLAEFLKLSGLVGGFADDLDDDVVEGSLGVDVGDTDFAVLEVEFSDTLLNSLYKLDNAFGNFGINDLHFGQRTPELPQLQDQRRIENACHRKAGCHQ